MTDMANMPMEAPAPPLGRIRYADVAVTATAKDFAGIYRGKQYHPPDLDHVLDRAVAAGVDKIVLTGMSISDVSFNLDVARRRPAGTTFVTVGIHPYHAAEPAASGDADAHFAELAAAVETASAADVLAAFGELGLDYDRLNVCGKDEQLRTFRAQLDLFVREAWDLPLFLHCRAAFSDFAAVLAPYLPRLPRGGLVHSFVGSPAEVRVLAEEMGLGVSVNGFSFRDDVTLNMVRHVPLAKLQLETDAPWGEVTASMHPLVARYLAKLPSPTVPSKKRDKFEAGKMVKGRNESCCIDRVAYVVAGLKGLSVEEVANASYKNSTDMFRLDRS